MLRLWNEYFPRGGTHPFHAVRYIQADEAGDRTTESWVRQRDTKQNLAGRARGATEVQGMPSRRGWIKFVIFVAQIAEHSKV